MFLKMKVYGIFLSINKMQWMNKRELLIKSIISVTTHCLQNSINSSYTCTVFERIAGRSFQTSRKTNPFFRYRLPHILLSLHVIPDTLLTLRSGLCGRPYHHFRDILKLRIVLSDIVKQFWLCLGLLSCCRLHLGPL